jgi:Na+/proline symporter
MMMADTNKNKRNLLINTAQVLGYTLIAGFLLALIFGINGFLWIDFGLGLSLFILLILFLFFVYVNDKFIDFIFSYYHNKKRQKIDKTLKDFKDEMNTVERDFKNKDL